MMQRTKPRLTDEEAEFIEKLHSGDFHLSYSALQHFEKSPGAFMRYRLAERKETRAMRGGSFAHCYLLEPEKLAETFIISPDVNGGTKEGKEAWREFVRYHTGEETAARKIEDFRKEVEAATGKSVIEGAEAEKRLAQIRAINRNETAMGIIGEVSDTEKPVFWGFQHIDFVGKIDMEGPEFRADLKTVTDATFERRLRDLRSNLSRVGSMQHIYPAEIMQAAHYQNALGYKDFFIISVDGDGEVSVVFLRPETINAAGERIHYLARRFNDCLEISRFYPEVWIESQDFWARETGGIISI